MPNTETNKKHQVIVELLKKELEETGCFCSFYINTETGYDIRCQRKINNKTIYFTALLYGDRLYDATTLEEWEMAIKNLDSYYFVAYCGSEYKRAFYYFSSKTFMQTCSIPKFKIRSSLRKRDLNNYKNITEITTSHSRETTIYPTQRRTAIQLTVKNLKSLSEFWKELTSQDKNDK